MKFINDSILNNLVSKINSIFRIDSKNKIRHDDLSTRLFQGEKIILKHNGETRPYFESNGKLSYGGKTAFKIGEITHNDNKLSFIALSDDDITIHGESYPYKRIYINKNYGVCSTMPFYVYGGVYGAENVQHKTAYLQDHTVSGKELYIKYLNPLPPKLRTGDGTHITDYSYKDTYFLANDVTTVQNIKNKETSLVFTLEYKEQIGHGYKGMTFHSNIDFNDYDLYNVYEIFVGRLNGIDLHAKYFYGHNLYLKSNSENCSVSFNSDTLIYRYGEDDTRYSSKMEIWDKFLHLDFRNLTVKHSPANTRFHISLNTYNNIQHSNIDLRAGRSCKIEMISNVPISEFNGDTRNTKYDNSGERINIYGSIYFPHVDENIPGVNTSNYTTAQLNTLSNTPLQGIILDLMKQNQNLQSQIDTLINQLNNLS